MNKKSPLLARRVTAFVRLLSNEMVERMLAQLPEFIREDQLQEWIATDGRRCAVAYAMMELAKAELGEGSDISMMQYLRFKHATLAGDCDVPEFDQVERILLTDFEGSDAKAFLADIWSLAFIQRIQRRFVSEPVIQLVPSEADQLTSSDPEDLGPSLSGLETTPS